MRCSISGGGTGGHIYPALAVAQALSAARPELELDYIGGVRGLEQRIVGSTAIPYHELIVRSLRSPGLSPHTAVDAGRLFAAGPQAWWLLGRLGPAALFSTGGYLAVPLVAAARARRIPSIVWEGNVIPGRATRALGRLATRVAVSFPPTVASFPEGRAFVSGTPIRSFAGVDRSAARAFFGVPDGDRLLLVFGGSQAVARFNAALLGALPRLLGEWHVLYLAGDTGLPEALAAREALPPALADRFRAEAFLTNRMPDALVAADLVMGRAGSSTCAELAAVGVASILVPYPFAGAHQRANAEWLRSQGAARTVPDAELDADRLIAEVAALTDDAARRRMADAARGLGLPDSAARIADELLMLAERRGPARAGA